IPVWSGEAHPHDANFITNVMPAWGKETAQQVAGGETFFGTSDGPDKPWYAWTIARKDPKNGKWYLWTCVSPDRPDQEKSLESRGYVQDPDVLDTWFSSG